MGENQYYDDDIDADDDSSFNTINYYDHITKKKTH